MHHLIPAYLIGGVAFLAFIIQRSAVILPPAEAVLQPLRPQLQAAIDRLGDVDFPLASIDFRLTLSDIWTLSRNARVNAMRADCIRCIGKRSEDLDFNYADFHKEHKRLILFLLCSASRIAVARMLPTRYSSCAAASWQYADELLAIENMEEIAGL